MQIKVVSCWVSVGRLYRNSIVRCCCRCHRSSKIAIEPKLEHGSVNIKRVHSRRSRIFGYKSSLSALKWAAWNERAKYVYDISQNIQDGLQHCCNTHLNMCNWTKGLAKEKKKCLNICKFAGVRCAALRTRYFQFTSPASRAQWHLTNSFPMREIAAFPDLAHSLAFRVQTESDQPIHWSKWKYYLKYIHTPRKKNKANKEKIDTKILVCHIGLRWYNNYLLWYAFWWAWATSSEKIAT